MAHDLDLKVFISRTDECPNDSKFDYKFDFSSGLSSYQIGKIKIMPSENKSAFSLSEKFLHLGLYSLKGLPNIAFIYGFGRKYEFYLKNKLIEACTDPNQ